MYQTLYRKYRPTKFSEVVGQDVIVRTLSNSIKNNKISHAYMFFGPRGVGKTSIAKIFARAVNCVKGDGDICQKCEICNITSGKECLDIIEIDAASNNGVDEIRELRDKINLVPSQLKYKVYIIDEVHMLTLQAFNALLKTLEEPPSHVIFILATTDSQKVPETIVSRCQCFSFNRISEKDIVLNLKNICNAENIVVDDDVLLRIATASNGGMRDSIGMLDKLYAYCDNTIKLSDYIKLNKIVSDDDVLKLINYIYNNNMKDVIDLIDTWNSDGINIIQLAENVLLNLKNIIVLSIEDKDSQFSDINRLIELSNIINEKMFELKKSGNPKIYLEIMFLDFMNKNSKIISREIISQEEKKVKNEKNSSKIVNINESISKEENSSKTNVKGNQKEPLNSNIEEILEIRLNNAFAKADKNELNKDKLLFQKLNDYTFDQNIGYLVCTLLDGNIRVSSPDVLVLSYEYDSVIKENLLHLDELSVVLNKILNINKKIVIMSDEKWNNEKEKYIARIKKNYKYVYMDEPDLIYNDGEIQKNQNNGSIFDDFGDIVEVE